MLWSKQQLKKVSLITAHVVLSNLPQTMSCSQQKQIAHPNVQRQIPLTQEANCWVSFVF